MTRTTYARIAGFMFLFYIVTGVTEMILFNPVDSAVGTAAKLASIVENELRVRLTLVPSLIMIVNALVLGAALYAITRDQDPDLALMALSFRICEGALNAIGPFAIAGLLWLGTGTAAAAPDPAAANALGTLFLKLQGWQFIIGAWVFSVGSMLYCYLFLRARSIPVWLAWLGLLGSILLALLLPAQLVGFIKGWVTDIIWVPLAVFEVVIGFWLLIKGVATPPRQPWGERARE